MYCPKHFDEPRTEILHALMRARPLATLVTHAADGLDANHIPLHLADDPLPLGTLRGHVARANPLWRAAGAGAEVLAIFHGPEGYITPAWYPSKAETGKAVPTPGISRWRMPTAACARSTTPPGCAPISMR